MQIETSSNIYFLARKPIYIGIAFPFQFPRRNH